MRGDVSNGRERTVSGRHRFQDLVKVAHAGFRLYGLPQRYFVPLCDPIFSLVRWNSQSNAEGSIKNTYSFQRPTFSLFVQNHPGVCRM